MTISLQGSLSRITQNTQKLVVNSAKAVVKVTENLATRFGKNQESAITFRDVYREELIQRNILNDDGKTETDESAHKRNLKVAWKAGLFGLAFSGGGIRSATFNLGVIQALSELRLLRNIHYLSVVSGGGYIGGWLTALLHRSDNRKTHKSHAEQFEQWEKKLSAVGGSEDPAISHLRNYSNYLTPKRGLVTADTWSAVATYLRNALLNQTILVATLLSVFIIGWLIAFEISWWASDAKARWGSALLVSVGASLIGAVCMGYNLSSIADRDSSTPNGWNDRGVFFGVVLPGIVGATAACVWLPYLANVSIIEAPGIVPEWLVELCPSGNRA